MSDSSASAPAPGTGGPRSAGTRRAILEAARTTFAARGYEQTTIRAVAARAGVDASMVMRYFGSKAGLFTTAATAELQVPDLRAVPAGERGELLVRVFVDRWEDAARDDELIVLRTAVTSETVAAQLQATMGQLITEPIAALGEDDAAGAGRSSRPSSSVWRCAGTSCASSRWPRCRPTTSWPLSRRPCSVTSPGRLLLWRP